MTIRTARDAVAATNLQGPRLPCPASARQVAGACCYARTLPVLRPRLCGSVRLSRLRRASKHVELLHCQTKTTLFHLATWRSSSLQELLSTILLYFNTLYAYWCVDRPSGSPGQPAVAQAGRAAPPQDAVGGCWPAAGSQRQGPAMSRLESAVKADTFDPVAAVARSRDLGSLPALFQKAPQTPARTSISERQAGRQAAREGGRKLGQAGDGAASESGGAGREERGGGGRAG